MDVVADHMAKPSGVVTFLFTDIEGSTRRWEADADGMRAALEQHDQVLHEAVTGFAGELFKHTGDGVCAVFASPRAAVDAAVAAQRSLELPVRMGIATGEAERRANDYFGTVLNRAARVMSAGHGGQILLDGLTADLLSGIDLLSLGSRRLRDLANPVAMHQVRAPGLDAKFPPLRTADPTPGNLRVPSTSFVGRDAELVEVETALNAHRLVTLIGVGGVGKTRLALETAARVAHRYHDGVWVIELASVSDPSAVPEAVAAVLGITQQPGVSLTDSVSGALEGRSRLLVFDNCEHVLDAAGDMIEAILTRSDTIGILATSREGLRVVDEQLWPVPSLDVDSSAATLFLQRASAVAPAVSLANDIDRVAEICRRLDGIPLAIELAASRMVSMTATELRDRLDDRFRLLVGSRRGMERHQTLRHAVQWSYDLLDHVEKVLLQRCSVFAGGFDLAAASGVTGSDDEYATLDQLDALVRKSLMVADRSSGRTRFSMLETIRQFAQDQLVAGDQADDARAAHARYFAGREADVLTLWNGPRQHEAYEWFTVEFANLRAAFRWAADHHDLDTSAAIAVYATFLGSWVEQYEPIAWAEELLESAQVFDHRRLAQLCVMAAQCFLSGRVEDFLGYSQAGAEALLTGRFDPAPYEFEAIVGGGYFMAGQPARWVELCRSVIAREQGSHVAARTGLVLGLTFVGSVNEAIAACDGLLLAADATHNPQLSCWARFAYGCAYRDADPAAAQAVQGQGLQVAHGSGNRFVEANIAVPQAALAARRGDSVNALDYLTLAIRHYYDSGSFSLMAQAMAVLAAHLDNLGCYEPAAIMSEFADTPLSRLAWPQLATAITHLRQVLGDDAYESLARAGNAMTPAAMANYAFEQIDLARAALP